jgi:hypothetical protein
VCIPSRLLRRLKVDHLALNFKFTALEGFPADLNRGDSQRVRGERFFVH